MDFSWFLDFLQRLDGIGSTADTIGMALGLVPSWLMGFLFLSIGVSVFVGIICLIIDLI